MRCAEFSAVYFIENLHKFPCPLCTAVTSIWACLSRVGLAFAYTATRRLSCTLFRILIQLQGSCLAMNVFLFLLLIYESYSQSSIDILEPIVKISPVEGNMMIDLDIQ